MRQDLDDGTLQVDWFDENGTLTNDSWPEGTVKITDKDGKEPADEKKLDEGNAYLVYTKLGCNRYCKGI